MLNADWHTLSIGATAEQLEANVTEGLTDAEAERRLAEHGPNLLVRAKERSLVAILIGQFRSLLVAMLAVAATVAFASGDRLEGAAILVVILLNALIGFLTEWKAARTLSALREQSVVEATVVRGGAERRLPAADIVVGDLVILSAGERVPADGRLVESVRLQVEESALTGESSAVRKESDAEVAAEAALGDRLNVAFMGTAIAEGRGRLLVTAIGAGTEMGKIGTLIDEASVRATPLEAKLARLGRLLLFIVLGLCAVIILGGWLRGNDFLVMLEVGISLAIAAVPEGLPAVSTMTLAIGMQRMARMGALVRRLPAVETLGSTTVICTDKTGTLTQNEMTVTALMIDARRIAVSGTGYETVGSFTVDGVELDAAADARVSLGLKIGALCNDATVSRVDGRHAVLGDPTEAALLVVAEKAGFTATELEAESPRADEVPFDSITKRMVTVHRHPDAGLSAFLKGSPAAVLDVCTSELGADGPVPMSAESRERWVARNVELAGEALRVLALAYRELPPNHTAEDYARDAVLVGLVGMRDPLREEAKAAIATCRRAGIRTIMITGDQQATAAEIAKQLEIDRDDAGAPMRIVHAGDLTSLDAAGWKAIVAETAVFARVTPKHKLQVVEALQASGAIVAMTGDGVNDAPALKQADIGIAMGIKGTDVAKESADMVIVDDNFATIIRAVEQGRIIFANIERFIHYLFSCNCAEVIVVFVAIMVGWPLPLLPLQILWLNMLTDIFPALALALEPSSPDSMREPPRDPTLPLLPKRFVIMIAWQGVLLASVTLGAFVIGLARHGDTGTGLRQAGTMAFMALTLSQVLHAFNVRSQEQSIFTRRLFTNGWLWAAVLVCLGVQAAAVYVPALQRVLHTVPLPAADWLVIGAAALLPILVVEGAKLARRVRS
jgi:Ca2+-transporting ATPase